MTVLVNPADTNAVRNKDNILALYDLMINQKNAREAVAKFLIPEYIQHNPAGSGWSSRASRIF